MRNLLIPGLLFLAFVLLPFIAPGSGQGPGSFAKTVRVPPAAAPNAHYVSNRSPLTVRADGC
jgi:hypothetical protein